MDGLPDAFALQTCFAAISDACISAGFAVRRTQDSTKMKWSRPCLQAYNNCPVPSML
jgi:hypothetical protein